MQIIPHIFKDYDLRAIIPDELDFQGAEYIAEALTYYFKPKKIAIGYDMRKSSLQLFKSLARGFLRHGVNVTDLGLISTDMVYFAAGKYNYDLVMTLTASHNPPEYNGIKLAKKGAIPVSGESGWYKIRDLIFSQKKFKLPLKKGKLTIKKIHKQFVKHCLSFINLKKIKPFKCVIDAGNGMAGYIMPMFEKYLPLKVTHLYYKLDGSFPNHIPNPLVPDNIKDLQKKVLETKADFGIAFDGDADRIYFIDEKANFISGTVMTAMLAEKILQKKPNELILANAVSGRIVSQIVKKFKGRYRRVRVGHTLIKEAMRKYNAVFAGEHSAHYYFRDNYYADSGFVAMLLFLELISEKEGPLSKIVKKYDIYPVIPETNFEFKKDLLTVMKKIETKVKKTALKIDWLDGITIWYKDSWVNIRPSNTQPLLRLNIEADNKKILKKRVTYFTKLIIKQGGKKFAG